MPKIEHAKRGLRRQKFALKRQRARKLYSHDKSGRLANHLAACSCEMCGNPRRHFGNSHTRTVAELRSIDKMHEQMRDLAGEDELLAA